MPAAKIILSWVNHVDSAVLSASNAAGDGAVANLASPIVGRRWRTTSLTAYVDVDFGENKTIGVLALRFPRDTAFPSSGTVTHALDADGGTPGTGATYTSGEVNIAAAEGYGYHVHVPASAQSARHWRFTFAAAGVSFIDVGRAWAGEAWRPEFNIGLGYEDVWADLSQISASARSGAEFADERARQRLFAFGLNALSESERDEIREMSRIVGASRQVLFVKDPESPSKDTVLGRLAGTTPIAHPELPIYSKAFEIRESL